MPDSHATGSSPAGNWEWCVLLRPDPNTEYEVYDWYGTDDQAAKEMATMLRARGNPGSWAYASLKRRPSREHGVTPHATPDRAAKRVTPKMLDLLQYAAGCEDGECWIGRDYFRTAEALARHGMGSAHNLHTRGGNSSFKVSRAGREWLEAHRA